MASFSPAIFVKIFLQDQYQKDAPEYWSNWDRELDAHLEKKTREIRGYWVRKIIKKILHYPSPTLRRALEGMALGESCETLEQRTLLVERSYLYNYFESQHIALGIAFWHYLEKQNLVRIWSPWDAQTKKKMPLLLEIPNSWLGHWEESNLPRLDPGAQVSAKAWARDQESLIHENAYLAVSLKNPAMEENLPRDVAFTMGLENLRDFLPLLVLALDEPGSLWEYSLSDIFQSTPRERKHTLETLDLWFQYQGYRDPATKDSPRDPQSARYQRMLERSLRGARILSWNQGFYYDFYLDARLRAYCSQGPLNP